MNFGFIIEFKKKYIYLIFFFFHRMWRGLPWISFLLVLFHCSSGEVSSWTEIDPYPGDPPDPSPQDDTVIQRIGRAQTFSKPTQLFGQRQPPLGRLSSLFEPNSWSNPNQDIPGYKQLSGQCRSALRLFASALANQTLWAARSELLNFYVIKLVILKYYFLMQV